MRSAIIFKEEEGTLVAAQLPLTMYPACSMKCDSTIPETIMSGSPLTLEDFYVDIAMIFNYIR